MTPGARAYRFCSDARRRRRIVDCRLLIADHQLEGFQISQPLIISLLVVEGSFLLRDRGAGREADTSLKAFCLAGGVELYRMCRRFPLQDQQRARLCG